MIDIIFFILIAFAIYKGYSKGFIIAITSVLGFIIGLAAALKLSATVATSLAAHTNLGKWLPAISFLIVFIAAAFLVRFIGNLAQKTFETIMLGWANRVAGILLFALLYSLIYSVFLFYAVQLNVFLPSAISASVSYPYLQPLGPKVIAGFAVVVPWCKDMFAGLQTFFGGFAHK